MTREEKYVLVQELTETLKQHPNFIVLDTGGMTVEKMNNFRRACFKSKLKVQVVKNTLFKKALQNLDSSYETIYPVLKQNTTVVFANENLAEPAKVLKNFREDAEIPKFKAAYIEGAVYIGEENLDSVASIKSKQEVLGDVIGLLKSPITQLVGLLQSSGTTIHSLLKTIEEKNKH